MKGIRRNALVATLLATLGLTAGANAELTSERTIEGISVQTQPGGMRLRIQGDRSLRYTVTQNPGSSRLLVDLPDANLAPTAIGALSGIEGISARVTEERGQRAARLGVELPADATVAAHTEGDTVIVDLRGDFSDRLLADAGGAPENIATDAGQGAAAAEPNGLRGVHFEQDGAVDRIVIDLPPGATCSSLPWSDGHATLLVEGATLPEALRRTMDTAAFRGPVTAVSSFVDGQGQVRVVVALRGAASELVRQSGNRVAWEFTASSPAPAAPAQSSQAAPAAAPAQTSQAADLSVPASATENPFQRRPRLNRKRITIDLRNADIHNILRLIADEGNVNIVTTADVTGSVTLRLRAVPLDEALAIILRSNSLGWEQQNNIIRVAPLAVFERENQARIQAFIQSQGLAPLQVRLIPINYAESSQIRDLLKGVLSSRGNVAVDSRNNTLIVTDVVQNLDTVEALVQQLDTQTPQILIEARVVESNDQFKRELGIQWGGDFLADQSIGNATGLLFPSTIGLAGGASGGETPTSGGSATPNYAVNMPAAAGLGSGGAVGFTFGSLSGAFNLNIRLSAAESQGSVKIISAPRIMAMDNESATISSGVSIPISVVSAAGAQTVFVDASLKLDVTPRVTPDGNIVVKLNVTKNEPDFENTGSRGDPSIIRREANTTLLVRDGDTTVIGGIFQRNTGESESRVPFFASLPIIGPLFHNASHTDVRNELLVFLTPRIVNRDKSIDRAEGNQDLTPPQAK